MLERGLLFVYLQDFQRVCCKKTILIQKCDKYITINNDY